MKAKLFCKSGKLAGAFFEILDEAVIGRGSTNDVVLRHESISGQHARLSFDSDRGRYVIEDLGSLNGTEVDGLPIAGPEVLDHLHVITFAEDHDFIFHASDLVQPLEAKGEGHEITEVELDVPVFPEPSGAGTQRDEDHESTQVDREVVILPQDLVERAASTAEDSSGEDEHGTEQTRIEADFPLPLRVLEEAAGALGDDREETSDGQLEVRATDGREDSGAEAPVEEIDTVDSGEERHETSKKVTTSEFESQSPFAALAVHDRWFLEVENLEGRDRLFELCEGENLIGRGAEMQVQLETPELSRRHAALILEEARLVIRDEGSQNGTYVEEKRLEGQREIQPGTRLRFATVAATVKVRAHNTEKES